MMYKVKTQTGFTLIETLVAVTILVIAVLGPMTMLSSAISNSTYAKNQVTATFLAQEGLEFIINERDEISNRRLELFPPEGEGYFEGINWLAGPSDGSIPYLSNCINNYCQVDTINWAISSCGAALCADKLRINRDRLYQYDPVTDNIETIFSRSVKIEPIEETDGSGIYNEARVKSRIDWQDKNVPRWFEFETIITKQGN